MLSNMLYAQQRVCRNLMESHVDKDVSYVNFEIWTSNQAQNHMTQIVIERSRITRSWGKNLYLRLCALHNLNVGYDAIRRCFVFRPNCLGARNSRLYHSMANLKNDTPSLSIYPGRLLSNFHNNRFFGVQQFLGSKAREQVVFLTNKSFLDSQTVHVSRPDSESLPFLTSTFQLQKQTCLRVAAQ